MASGAIEAMPRPGGTIGGKYRLVRLLGEGGMASIYEGRHLKLSQRVAIKILAPEFANDAELVERLEREARALSLLETRHVARVIDVDVGAEGLPFIVMEFLEGQDLEAELNAKGSLTIADAVDLVVQACSAMVEVHAKSIVHRDLKPANLFVTTHEGRRIVKIIDFGISKLATAGKRLTAAGAVMGTVLYMSPEQVRASSSVDHRADIWSIGVILFELVAGKPPWSGSPAVIATKIVTETAPSLDTFVPVPAPFAAVVKRLLAREEAERPQSMRAVIELLAPFIPENSVSAEIAAQLGISVDMTATAQNKAPQQFTLPMGTSRTPGLIAPTPLPSAATSTGKMPMRGATLPLDAQRPPNVPPPPASQPVIEIAPPASSRSTVLLVVSAILIALAITGIVLIVLSLRQPLPRESPSRPAPTTSTAR